jgi:hypothetical protein
MRRIRRVLVLVADCIGLLALSVPTANATIPGHPGPAQAWSGPLVRPWSDALVQVVVGPGGRRSGALVQVVVGPARMWSGRSWSSLVRALHRATAPVTHWSPSVS